jgi:D-xylose transport system permease protein
VIADPGETPAGTGVGTADLTLDANAATADVPPELLAQSLGQYFRASWLRVRGGNAGVLPVILALVVVAIGFQIANSKFLGAQNLVNLFEQSTIYMLLAIAEIFALLLGEIDLSVGLVMGLSSVVVAELVQPTGANWPWWAAIIVALLASSAFGAIQGTLVARLKMPSFIVTLGGLLILEGVAIIVLGGSLVGIGNLQYTNEAFLYNIFWGTFNPVVSWILLAVVVGAVGTGLWLQDARKRRRNLETAPRSLIAMKIALIAVAGIAVVALCNVNRAHVGTIDGVPYIIPIVLIVLAASTALLQRTRFGRYVYAIGGNPEAARRAGVRLPAIRTWCFMLAGLISGIAGVLFASWQVSLTTNIIKAANSYVLLAVAAAVIGGTSLFGGRGKTIHGVLGGLVIGGIYNGLYLLGVSSQWIDVVVAGVLLAAALIDVLSRRGASGRGLRGPGAGSEDRHVQGHERPFKIRQGASLAGADDGPDEFAAGARQCLVRLAGDGRPFRVSGASPPGPRTGCAEEAILLVREVRVEHRAGHPRSLDDVGDGNGGVAGVGDGCYHGPLQPFRVRCLDSARRQAVPAPGQAWLAFVRAGEASLGPGVGHKPSVTGQTLSSEQHQLHCSAGSAR